MAISPCGDPVLVAGRAEEHLGAGADIKAAAVSLYRFHLLVIEVDDLTVLSQQRGLLLFQEGRIHT